MTTELAPVPAALQPRIPALPWRDPHTVSPQQLAAHIEALEAACRAEPASAGLRTCLGMAYAMNYEVYKSMDALEFALQLEPDHFFAQLKYAELHYRLRALIKAETLALRALELASSPWEFSTARGLLQEIRRLMREGTQKPEWTKPLARPAFCVLGMTILFSLAMYLK